MCSRASVCWCSFTSSTERNPDARRVRHQAAVAVLTDVLQKLGIGLLGLRVPRGGRLGWQLSRAAR